MIKKCIQCKEEMDVSCFNKQHRNDGYNKRCNKCIQENIEMFGNPRTQNIIGQKYGKLTVIAFAGIGRQSRWECLCDCGNKTIVVAGALKAGGTSSCGCVNSERLRERNTTHHACETPEYNSWRAMIERCCNPNHKNYHQYGGRGIAVCERWRKFENFLSDMGHRPPNHSLDRINVNGNYEPGNCKWSTQKEQMQNTRVSKKYRQSNPTSQ